MGWVKGIWQDVSPEDLHFESANLLTLAGIWKPDPGSVHFHATQTVTRREMAAALARLRRSLPDAPGWPDYPERPRFTDLPSGDPDRAAIEALFLWGNAPDTPATFHPDDPATRDLLQEWLDLLQLPAFPSLVAKKLGPEPLQRDELLDYLHRVLMQRGEAFPEDDTWLQPGGDHDGDGIDDYNDALPFDRDNNSIPDRLQAPVLK